MGAEEEGSQQRQYYSRLVERAGRRKAGYMGGGSVTLLLLQPSVSVLPSGSSRKAEYTLKDFEEGGFTQTVCTRVAMLEGKGIKLTEEVLVKVGIPVIIALLVGSNLRRPAPQRGLPAH